MRLEGRVWKDKKHWLVEVPMLDVMTQGRTRKEALEMLADAVGSLVNRQGFKLDVHAGAGQAVDVGANDVAALTALLLRRQREMRGLSLADASRLLNQSSRNAYARYEQGKSVPTVEKLDHLLTALSGQDLVLRMMTAVSKPSRASHPRQPGAPRDPGTAPSSRSTSARAL